MPTMRRRSPAKRAARRGTVREGGSPVENRAAGRHVHDLTFAVHVPDDLARCVVMLERSFTETVKVDGEDAEVWLKLPGAPRSTPKRAKHLGTGFLVATRSAAFLVTAAHVARAMDREARLSFGTLRGRRVALRLSDLLSLRASEVAWTYLRHADVAAVCIPKPPVQLRRHFLPGHLLVADRAAPAATLELTAIGFPLGLTSEKHFAPLAKTSHAASQILRFCGEEIGDPGDFFLLDQPSMGGYSGAPLFVPAQVQLTDAGQVTVVAPRCVGLISRTISDETRGQFAAVVPSGAIRRAMAKARLRR
jgi:hypothetical protein